MDALKLLLENQISDEMANNCIAVLSGGGNVRISKKVAPIEEIFHIYETRSKNPSATSTIFGYDNLLINLSERLKINDQEGIQLHLVFDEIQWFQIFTNEDLSVLFGILYSKSSRMYSWYETRPQ